MVTGQIVVICIVTISGLVCDYQYLEGHPASVFGLDTTLQNHNQNLLYPLLDVKYKCRTKHSWQKSCGAGLCTHSKGHAVCVCRMAAWSLNVPSGMTR